MSKTTLRKKYMNFVYILVCGGINLDILQKCTLPHSAQQIERGREGRKEREE